MGVMGPARGDYAALARVATAASDAAEARLAALRLQEGRLREQIRDLDGARRARAAEALAPDLALRAGVDLKWELWIERRRAAALAELARLLARVERAKDELRQGLGRRAVTESLAADAATARLARLAKAEERGW